MSGRPTRLKRLSGHKRAQGKQWCRSLPACCVGKEQTCAKSSRVVCPIGGCRHTAHRGGAIPSSLLQALCIACYAPSSFLEARLRAVLGRAPSTKPWPAQAPARPAGLSGTRACATTRRASGRPSGEQQLYPSSSPCCTCRDLQRRPAGVWVLAVRRGQSQGIARGWRARPPPPPTGARQCCKAVPPAACSTLLQALCIATMNCNTAKCPELARQQKREANARHRARKKVGRRLLHAVRHAAYVSPKQQPWPGRLLLFLQACLAQAADLLPPCIAGAARRHNKRRRNGR